MKRIATFLPLIFLALGSFAQPLVGVSWVSWINEPDYEGVTGYAENPYDNPIVVIPQVDEIPLGTITRGLFDQAWTALGDSITVANLTSNGVAGDPFDLGEGNTFGAAWKGIHDGTNFYLLLKYWDTNAQADEGSRTFEIMAQPTSFKRHEPTFVAASDSTENTVAYQNMAYARYIELGGGKAVFNNGSVTAYEGSMGLSPDKKAWIPYVTSNWGSNDPGLLALAQATHFWDVDEEGTIRAVMIMSFDGALAYPSVPENYPDGEYTSLKVGDTIAFDVKSNAAIGGTEGDNKIEYFWSSDKNNGYASNFYSGWLVMAPKPAEPGEVALVGVSWVDWLNEPAYEGVTGYADNPYDNPQVDILTAPPTWSFDGISDATTFDETWGILGDSLAVANLTSNGVAGDPFDLGVDNTFGAAWKGIHDASNFYVFLKYWDVNAQVDEGSRTFEIMAQPTSPVRHEFTFTAAGDSTENTIAYQNMAYARYIELGGGKAVFNNGSVTAYEGSMGLSPDKKAWIPYVTSNWGSNDPGLLALASATHFWDVDEEGTIRAVMVMSLDGALAYPTIPENYPDGDYTALKVGDTFAFDVKTNAAIGGTEGDNKIEYFWSSDANNGYASNYYSGHLTLSDEILQVVGLREKAYSNITVYIHNDFLSIKGVERANVKLYNITGSLVKSMENVSGVVDVSDISDGVYIVKLEGIQKGFKVVK